MKKQMTQATIESIIGTSVEELAVRDINEVLAKDATPATWKLTSITIGHIESATTERKPVRMTEKQAEAIIAEANKVEAPTTEELQSNMDRLIAKYEAAFGLDYHTGEEIVAEVSSEASHEDFKSHLEKRNKAHRVFESAQKAFREYADSPNADYEEVKRLHKVSQDAHKAYREVANA